MRVHLFYHDHCFDGAATAAVFTEFYRQNYDAGAEFAYTGLAHKASQLFDESQFDGDENVIVDFKYSPSPRITWWFDHHQSAFLSPEDAEHFRRDRSGQKFYDPTFKSCTKFLATVAKEKFDFERPGLGELIRWADIIDGAQYPDAKTAVELGAPAMKLTLVIESSGGNVSQKMIQWMPHRSLDEIAREPEIEALFAPLYRRHVESIDLIRERAECRQGVIFFDLVGCGREGYNKFIPYYLFPESVYTVSVSESSFRTKVSVGSNPWAPREPRQNLATICERYGGGGHARVGAISFEPGELERARKAAREIVEVLRQEG
ncbi:MAG TPA: phosphoesterase [Bryobacterales bacterium]|nr:phosphoesterase [Bryobacterales bacterium]